MGSQKNQSRMKLNQTPRVYFPVPPGAGEKLGVFGQHPGIGFDKSAVMAHHHGQGDPQQHEHQRSLEQIGPGHGPHAAAQGVQDDDGGHQHASPDIGKADQGFQGVSRGHGLKGQVGDGEDDHHQGEEKGEPRACVKGPDQFRGGDQVAVAPHPPDLAADDPEGQGHEAGAEAHDGKKRRSRRDTRRRRCRRR